MRGQREIEFLYEVGSLRYIARTWKRFSNAGFQNLAEHHLRVVWIALMIAKHENVTNTDKIMKMAIVHDIPESRAGDVDDLSRQYVTRNEELGLTDMLNDTILEEEFVALWHEYEKRESIEAKIVKDADNLDVDFELQEQLANGYSVAKAILPNRKVVYEHKLYTKTAKVMWQALYKVSPHDWHRNGRTRLNAGDWKI